LRAPPAGGDPANAKDLHRPLAQADDLDEILAWREEHYDKISDACGDGGLATAECRFRSASGLSQSVSTGLLGYRLALVAALLKYDPIMFLSQ